MIRLKTDIHVQEAVEALPQQSGADQQHHGDRQLHHDEVRSEAAPRGSRRAPAAFRKVVSQLG